MTLKTDKARIKYTPLKHKNTMMQTTKFQCSDVTQQFFLGKSDSFKVKER